VFVGKFAANFVLLGAVQAATALIFALVFDLDLLPIAPELALVVALGSVGVCSIGTLLSAMAVRTRFREVLLPILLLPFLFPVIRGAVQGTTALLAHEPLPFPAVQLLLVVDGVYLIASFLTFEYVLDE
jgi:heme exporter protein B